MGIWKRAWIYITRKKCRSILLFLVLFVTASFLLAGIAVCSAANQAAEEVKKEVASSLTISIKIMDRNDIWDITKNEEGREISTAKFPMLTHKNLDRILALDGVVGYDMGRRGNNDCYTDLDLKPGKNAKELVDMETDPEWLEYMRNNPEEGGQLKKKTQRSSRSLNFYSFRSGIGKWDPAFLNGSLEMVEGRNIERGDKRKTAISTDTAIRNHLSIGDRISMRHFDYITGELYGSTFEVEVVGIFRINFNQPYSEDMTYEQDILDNIAFTDMEMDEWGIEEWHKHHGTLYGSMVGEAAESVSGIRLYVEKPEQLPVIREQILAMDDVAWDYYDVLEDDYDYRTVARPLLLIEKLFTVSVVALSLGLLAVLSLIMTMWMKSRRHEIGILLSIGVKKRTVWMQLVLECCMIATAAFCFTGVCGRPLADTVGGAAAKMFGPSEGDEAFQVEFQVESDAFEIRKQNSEQIVLDYAVAPDIMARVYLMILGVAAGAVLFASNRTMGEEPGKILLRN